MAWQGGPDACAVRSGAFRVAQTPETLVRSGAFRPVEPPSPWSVHAVGTGHVTKGVRSFGGPWVMRRLPGGPPSRCPRLTPGQRIRATGGGQTNAHPVSLTMVRVGLACRLMQLFKRVSYTSDRPVVRDTHWSKGLDSTSGPCADTLPLLLLPPCLCCCRRPAPAPALRPRLARNLGRVCAVFRTGVVERFRAPAEARRSPPGCYQALLDHGIHGPSTKLVSDIMIIDQALP